MEWERRWNLARVIRREVQKTPWAEALMREADFVLECGDYVVLFKRRYRTRRVPLQVRMSEKTTSSLKKLSVREGIPTSDLVNEMISSFEGIPPVSPVRRKVGENRLMLYLDEDVAEKVKKLAEETGVSRSEVVRAILEERLSATG